MDILQSLVSDVTQKKETTPDDGFELAETCRDIRV
jgi:hypothetical protein